MAEIIAIVGIVVPAVVSHVAPLFVDSVKRKVEEGKVSLADLYELLDEGLGFLLALQKDRSDQVSKNSEKEDTTKLYELWNKRVSDIKEDLAPLKTDYEKEIKKEKEWRFPEIQRRLCRKRRCLKERIKKALKGVIGLFEKCPSEILVDKPPEPVIKEDNVPSIENYTTMKKALTDILTVLPNDNVVKCVALHGQKGVGKTTIMRNLNNHFYNRSIEENLKFDMVIFIKVPADKQTKEGTERLHILQKIAERIKMGTEGDESEVVKRIQKVLENKRYLLILDSIRHAVVLDVIWGMLDISNHTKNSKVVIATHYSRATCVRKLVKLEMLTGEEAWDMFRDIVGVHNKFLQSPKAFPVCERFGCRLPLLIHCIAKSVLYQDCPPDWDRALKEWTPWYEAGVDGLKELYSNLKCCYQLLGDQRKQKCFLYASLYPANSKIYTHYFVECCIVQGFLDDDVANTKYSEMRMRVDNTILRHLINVAFLEEVEEGEEGEKKRYVIMNDFYRQFALDLLSKDPNLQGRIYQNEERNEASLTLGNHVKWVSMVGSENQSPPIIQYCGTLQTLLLHKNLKLTQIPTDYFRTMGNLLVLNLYGTKISSLPALEDLTGLKAFYLNGCSELNFSKHEIHPLKRMLEVFDIRGTQVNFVPGLDNLRCLRISYTANCDFEDISMLRKLEEFIIEVERQFQPQWHNDAQHIKRIVDPRIAFKPNLK